jgi:hypothetical protein
MGPIQDAPLISSRETKWQAFKTSTTLDTSSDVLRKIPRARVKSRQKSHTATTVYITAAERGGTHVAGKQYPVPNFTQIRQINSAIKTPIVKISRENARVNRELLESTWSVDSKSALLVHVFTCGHDWTGCGLADTSCTLVRARSARGFPARSIFLWKSLSKVADVFDQYPTNIPYIRGTCGTCTSSGW